MLEIKNLHVKIADEDKTILKGSTLISPEGRSARDHGAERFGQVDAGLCAGRPRRLRSDRRRHPLERRVASWRWSPMSGLRQACSWPSSIRWKFRALPASRSCAPRVNAVRKKRGERRTDDAGVHEAREGARRQTQHRHRDAEASGQRRVLGRREEAFGNPADGDAGADAVRARRNRFRPRHRRACASSPTASTRCARRSARCSSSRTISGC